VTCRTPASGAFDAGLKDGSDKNVTACAQIAPNRIPATVNTFPVRSRLEGAARFLPTIILISILMVVLFATRCPSGHFLFETVFGFVKLRRTALNLNSAIGRWYRPTLSWNVGRGLARRQEPGTSNIER